MIKRFALLSLVAAIGCGDDTGNGNGDAGGSDAGGNGEGASGGAGDGGNVAEGGAGGASPSSLEQLLTRLRADRDGTLLQESYSNGWPVQVAEGLVVVSADPSLTSMAGDFNDWQPAALTADEGFSYGLLPVETSQRYKLSDGGENYVADPWSRSYDYDEFGEISLVAGAESHLERFFQVGDDASPIEARVVRVWVPEGVASHVLYMHDGQNLFDPNAFFGGWRLTETAPAGMMIVGIDNSAARMDEYTHVPDDIGQVVGGMADDYVAYLDDVVRPIISAQYGEPAVVGTMGSSLGGLISLYIGLTDPEQYDFVGSLSGTFGWGSFGTHTGETIIELYDAAGVLPFVVYLDSGGDGPCADVDGDGIQDDGAGTDNYCENIQMRDTLAADGWTFDTNLFHWHEPGAEHNEQAWGDRVFRPLEIFSAVE